MSKGTIWYIITPKGNIDPMNSFTVRGAVQLYPDREVAERLCDLIVVRDAREDYEVVPVELLAAEEEDKRRAE